MKIKLTKVYVEDQNKALHRTAPNERNPKKAESTPLHHPVPKPVASASPKNSFSFCSITTSLLVQLPRLIEEIERYRYDGTARRSHLIFLDVIVTNPLAIRESTSSYLQSTLLSCEAAICHLPSRFSQVSVQTWHTFASGCALSLPKACSLP